MAQALKPVLMAMLAAMAATASHAQPVSDPTRPPPQLYLAAPGASGDVASGEPQLQSLLISLRPGGRRVAVIDGKTLRQGERVGGAVLATIGDTYVVLRRGNQLQTIKLYRQGASAPVQP
jgi:MSHA biogenesis protein MshK